MRLGVNTGLVVVGRIGDDLRMDYTAQGDTTNLAARVMGRSDWGRVLATTPVLDRVLTDFDLQGVEPFTVKGKSAMIEGRATCSPDTVSVDMIREWTMYSASARW